MYTITTEATFSAAHALRGYQGPCENLHGHTWKVAISLNGEKLNHLGLLLDFKDVKSKLSAVLAEFDHQNLNALPTFAQINPSCENLSRIIYERLAPLFPQLVSVTVWESSSTSATFQLT